MQFKENELVQYVEMVWSSILDANVQRSHDLYPSDSTNVESCVQITGTWMGLVAINCPEPLAHRIAEIMFQMAPGSAGQEELQDALGEITNMIGGNMKALMPPPCHLSLPIVAVSGHSLHFPMTEVVCKVTMKSLDHLFQVTIMKQKESKFGPAKHH